MLHNETLRWAFTPHLHLSKGCCMRCKNTLLEWNRSFTGYSHEGHLLNTPAAKQRKSPTKSASSSELLFFFDLHARLTSNNKWAALFQVAQSLQLTHLFVIFKISWTIFAFWKLLVRYKFWKKHKICIICFFNKFVCVSKLFLFVWSSPVADALLFALGKLFRHLNWTLFLDLQAVHSRMPSEKKQRTPPEESQDNSESMDESESRKQREKVWIFVFVNWLLFRRSVKASLKLMFVTLTFVTSRLHDRTFSAPSTRKMRKTRRTNKTTRKVNFYTDFLYF
jgi:hypothetical protein